MTQLTDLFYPPNVGGHLSNLSKKITKLSSSQKKRHGGWIIHHLPSTFSQTAQGARNAAQHWRCKWLIYPVALVRKATAELPRFGGG